MKNLLIIITAVFTLSSCGLVSRYETLTTKKVKADELNGIFHAENGMGQTVEVEYLNGIMDVEHGFNDTKLNTMFKDAVRTAKYQVKHKRTFIPYKAFIYDNDHGGYIIAVDSYAKNSYGVEGKVSSLVFFKSNGYPEKDESGYSKVYSY